MTAQGVGSLCRMLATPARPVEKARSEQEHDAAKDVEDRRADERELDDRAGDGERGSEAAAFASKRQQESDVFACVKNRSREREERNEGAAGREPSPAPCPRTVADGEARDAKNRP